MLNEEHCIAERDTMPSHYKDFWLIPASLRDCSSARSFASSSAARPATLNNNNTLNQSLRFVSTVWQGQQSRAHLSEDCASRVSANAVVVSCLQSLSLPTHLHRVGALPRGVCAQTEHDLPLQRASQRALAGVRFNGREVSPPLRQSESHVEPQ